MNSYIPYGLHQITDDDIQAVTQILKSKWITQGPTVPAFEQAVAARCNAKHGVACNSATSALHVACLGLGLKAGDVLWTSPNTFVASANCALYCGADVDFVDIEPETSNLSVKCLKEKLQKAKQENQLPKIVVPVHFAGQPTDQEAIWELSQEYGFKIIEDASHAVGASRSNEPVGSCRWSDVTVFSFHPVKIITTGEGGLLLTNEDELATRMSLFRMHGITREPELLINKDPAPWYYEQQMLGFNYRMTDIQAALGLSQLQRLDELVARRNEIAVIYDKAFAELPLQLPVVKPENYSAFHLYAIRLLPDVCEVEHRRIFEELRARGIGVNLHYMPVHLQPYYREMGFKAGQFPEAESHGNRAISLPLYPDLTDEDLKRIIDAVIELTSSN